MTTAKMANNPALDASDATDRESWIARMDEICEDSGYFEPLGSHHWAFFVDEGPTLLVTFETLESIRSNPRQMPMGCLLAESRGWSHLCLISEGETWYRDPRVYRYFDRLVDDAFFEDFDRVVFYGAAMGGYAACAYSVCAPGATVVAVQPRATLDPAVAGWDGRHRKQRRLCFTDRYGYAPDMIEGTGEVFVIHDPWQTEDAMHAALFTKPFVTKLRTPLFGDRVERTLAHMDVLPEVLFAAGEGRLDRLTFARLMRKRRTYGPYLKAILARVGATGHPMRETWICQSVTRRINAPRFRRRLSELELAQDARMVAEIEANPA